MISKIAEGAGYSFIMIAFFFAKGPWRMLCAAAGATGIAAAEAIHGGGDYVFAGAFGAVAVAFAVAAILNRPRTPR